MQKLSDGVAHATFLAMAGLNRLGMSHLARGPIEVTEMLPAVAQGAIGVERRLDDPRAEMMLSAIHHGPTGAELTAERAFLLRLDGSCETPIAGLARLEGDQIWLRGEILRPDGSLVITGELRGNQADGARLGSELADDLLGRAGAGFFD
jgi:hydroxymethylbilane synthase